ncbi:hypothetical protein COO60DRAFT_1068988 [Scenedesmus sp. NREL 46B-D3]|nr:hypothetical protein COO60DRAFT_1068988 [Scenedesmus sp. NREL 46B-D3]
MFWHAWGLSRSFSISYASCVGLWLVLEFRSSADVFDTATVPCSNERQVAKHLLTLFLLYCLTSATAQLVPAQAPVHLVSKTGSQQLWRLLQTPVVQPLDAVAHSPRSLRSSCPSSMSMGASTRSTWCSNWPSRAVSWRGISSTSSRRGQSSRPRGP